VVGAVGGCGPSLLGGSGVDVGLAAGQGGVAEQDHDLAGSGAVIGQSGGVSVPQCMHEGAGGAAVADAGGPQGTLNEVLQSAAL
jgi:hypothetical protein